MKTLTKLICLFTLLLSGTFLFAQTKTSAASVAPTPQLLSAPVAPFGTTLFSVYGNLGSATAQQRAKTISDNIKKIRKDLLYKPELLTLVSEDGTEEIMYRDQVLLGVSDKQAAAEGKTKIQLAQEYRDILIGALDQARSSTLWLIILRQLFFAALILTITFYAVKYVNQGYVWLKNFLWKKKDVASGALHKIIDVNKQARFLLGLINALRIVVVAVLIYICFLSFLGLFPETRWLAGKLISLLFVPIKTVTLAVWNYLPNLLMIAVIAVLFRLVSKVLHVLAEKVSMGAITLQGFHPDWALPTYQIIWVILLIFTFIFVFPLLPNSSSNVFKGISVFLGVLLSLGSTSIINNVVSGLVITYMRPFKIGDRIKMGEHIGNVVEKSALVTRLRTPKNEIITIPNSTIMTANTVNYTNSASSYGLILSTKLTVGYEIEWRKVHELLIAAGLKTAEVLQDPKPFVLQNALDDFYVLYELNVYTSQADKMAQIYSELNQNIQDVFNEGGVELISAHITAVRDASMMFMPKQYLKPGREKMPPFQVVVDKRTPADTHPKKDELF